MDLTGYGYCPSQLAPTRSTIDNDCNTGSHAPQAQLTGGALRLLAKLKLRPPAGPGCTASSSGG
jgi:hypothetical protein